MRAWSSFVLLLPLLLSAPELAAEELLLATTTSVRDSGLLDAILPGFQAEFGIDVRVVAVGSGAALRMGERGDADVLITHAPEREVELVSSGALVSRAPFMHNHFVIAGPPDDPAGVGDAENTTAAIERIRGASARWISRADDSGTHMREQSLLRAAGIDPAADWTTVTRTGSGMGLTLQVAGERRAYVLSDLGTFLAFRERIDLVALSRPTSALLNVYSVLRVVPGADEPDRSESGKRFEAWLLSPDTARQIEHFGQERFGRALFVPGAGSND